MTERWRKKLGDLDKAGPGEDVFERAHEGPMQPDEVIPLPKTSTRVVTGAAAFLVFALAISVFAIPVLRMNDGPASPGSSGVLPLWPARSLDDLESLQQRADSGEADAVWALDPEQVAERFASDVLGWDAVAVLPDQGIWVEACSSMGACGITVECSYTSGEQVCPGFTYGSPSGNAFIGGPSTAAPSPHQWRTLRFGGDCERDRCPRDVGIRLFQPLEVGEDAIWTVLSASSEQNSLSVTTGEALRDGDEIFGGATLVDREVPAMAYHVGPGRCDVDDSTSTYTTTRGSLAGREQAGLTLPIQHGCTEPSPGYVWLATANESLVRSESGPIDPFIAGGQVQLQSLTAVPVTFLPASPDGGSSVLPTGPPTTESPIAEPIVWTTYTDPLGWTIDVPESWITERFDELGRVSSAGAHFASGDVTFIEGNNTPITRSVPDHGEVMVFIWHDEGGRFILPADDSAFPLRFDALDGDAGSFRADGLDFSILVKPGEGSDTITPEQEAIVRRMIESIRFEPWEPGEIRNGWAAAGPILPNAGTEWVVFDGERFFATSSEDGRAFFGPLPSCDGASYSSNEGGDMGIVCADGTSGTWNSSGVASSDNDPVLDANLDAYPMVRSWDGLGLVGFPQTN